MKDNKHSFINKTLFGGSLESPSGCIWLFAQQFWEVVGTYEWWFCLKIKSSLSGGGTQTLLAVKKFILSHSQVVETQKLRVQVLTPTASTHAKRATWWNFYYLTFCEMAYISEKLRKLFMHWCFADQCPVGFKYMKSNCRVHPCNQEKCPNYPEAKCRSDIYHSQQ